MSSLFPLRQAVTALNHFLHSGTPSTIDLIFTTSAFKTQVSIFLPVGSSDHQSILSCISLPSLSPYSTSSKVFPHKSHLYYLADFESINENLDKIDWQSILPSNVDEAWSSISSLICTTVQQFAPCKVATPHSLGHTALLHKLYNINLPPHLCSWFNSYLVGCFQSVRVTSAFLICA